jgi:IclR family transcriptional regulator, pca regulon regulatory protein
VPRSSEPVDPAWSQLSRKRQYSQSLERGLAILRCFTPQHPVLGIAEIADTLDMTPSTTHRYMSTLLALGYLEQDENRKYRLSLGVTDLGVSVMNATGLGEHAHHYLEELCRRTGYAASIAVLCEMDIVIVDHLRSRRAGYELANLAFKRGSRLPAYCTALGKALLASLPPQDLAEHLAQVKLTKLAPNTITSRKTLTRELDAIAQAGLAMSNEEYAVGVLSIAAPVRDISREIVAAIDISAPVTVTTVGDLVDELGPHVIATAGHVSTQLGFR